jgi:hypothetical protein
VDPTWATRTLSTQSGMPPRLPCNCTPISALQYPYGTQKNPRDQPCGCKAGEKKSANPDPEHAAPRRHLKSPSSPPFAVRREGQGATGNREPSKEFGGGLGGAMQAGIQRPEKPRCTRRAGHCTVPAYDDWRRRAVAAPQCSRQRVPPSRPAPAKLSHQLNDLTAPPMRLPVCVIGCVPRPSVGLGRGLEE